MPLLRRSSLAVVALVAPLVAPLLFYPSASGAVAGSTEGQIRLTAAWSGDELVSGERATVSGYARPAAAVSRAVLQRRTPDGWVKVAAVRPSTAKYTLRVPTGWLGTFRFRVKAVGTSGTGSAFSVAKRISIVPSYDPRGSAKSHAFAAEPMARWDSCKAIGYRVNTERARPGALKDVRGAVRRVYQATGLTFAYRGRTKLVPKDYYNTYPKDTQLVIAWARPVESPLLSSAGNPMGVGGAAWTLGFRNADGTPASRIDSGYVVIDSTQQARTPAGFGRGKTRGELLMHELGHAIGLRHVEDSRQLMYPLMQPGRARWGAGDLAGLERLGAARGCLS